MEGQAGTTATKQSRYFLVARGFKFRQGSLTLSTSSMSGGPAFSLHLHQHHAESLSSSSSSSFLSFWSLLFFFWVNVFLKSDKFSYLHVSSSVFFYFFFLFPISFHRVYQPLTKYCMREGGKGKEKRERSTGWPNG